MLLISPIDIFKVVGQEVFCTSEVFGKASHPRKRIKMVPGLSSWMSRIWVHSDTAGASMLAAQFRSSVSSVASVGALLLRLLFFLDSTMLRVHMLLPQGNIVQATLLVARHRCGGDHHTRVEFTEIN